MPRHQPEAEPGPFTRNFGDDAAFDPRCERILIRRFEPDESLEIDHFGQAPAQNCFDAAIAVVADFRAHISAPQDQASCPVTHRPLRRDEDFRTMQIKVDIIECRNAWLQGVIPAETSRELQARLLI